MAKVSFVTFYNEYSVGINVLSSLLIKAGHEVSVIFFKLPILITVPWFSSKHNEFMEYVDPYGNIKSGNQLANIPTTEEIDLLIKQLAILNPDMILFSTRTNDNPFAKEVLPVVRSQTKAITLAGGLGPSINPEVYAPLVDYVYIGEAEGCITDIIDALANGQPIEDFKGICYLKNEKLIRNPLVEPGASVFKHQIIPEETFYIESGKVYPFSDREKLMKTNSYSTFMGRGCIMSCSYCSIGNWINVYKQEGYRVKKRRNRPIEELIEELEQVKDTNITFIHFRDEYLTRSVKEMKQFFREYERRINLPFWAYLVPKQVLMNPELLEMAVDAGFVDTEIGFQSGSDRINREVFTRYLPHAQSLAYVKMLDQYNVNAKFDFIIFNPAEEESDIESTFKLIQELPKKRYYIFLPRLFYFPETPINTIMEKYKEKTVDFGHYYRIGLLYLICFVVPPDDFARIRKDKSLTGSWERLLAFYRAYLADNNITFPVGTHEVPGSITTHRYDRIIKKRQLPEAVVWGNGDYFRSMESIFSGVNIRYHIDHDANMASPDLLSSIKEPLPLFICSPDKMRIKQQILKNYPHYPGQIIV